MRLPSSKECRHSPATRWYGPASTVVMYVEIRSVGANSWRTAPGRSASGAGDAAMRTPLEETCQPSGARTVNRKDALRSGCSKFAKTRRASAGSYWVYR